jgi:hypothetical protein
MGRMGFGTTIGTTIYKIRIVEIGAPRLMIGHQRGLLRGWQEERQLLLPVRPKPPSERLWGLMHRNVTRNKFYVTCAQFVGATLGFLREQVPRNWAHFCDSSPTTSVSSRPRIFGSWRERGIASRVFQPNGSPGRTGGPGRGAGTVALPRGSVRESRINLYKSMTKMLGSK